MDEERLYDTFEEALVGVMDMLKDDGDNPDEYVYVIESDGRLHFMHKDRALEILAG